MIAEVILFNPYISGVVIWDSFLSSLRCLQPALRNLLILGQITFDNSIRMRHQPKLQCLDLYCL